MEFKEKYDVKRLEFLDSFTIDDYNLSFPTDINDGNKYKCNFTIFKKFLKNFIENDGSCTSIYKQNYDRGRFYADKGIQSMNKKIRNFLCDGFYTDIDIKNCYPTILKYICEKNNILCPQLTYYVDNRDIIYEKYKDNIDEIKTGVFTIMFGGVCNLKNDFIKSFNLEIKQLMKNFQEVEDFKKYKEKLTKNKLNKDGSACFCMIEDVEIKIMKYVISYLTSKKINILAYMYDGCMLYGTKYNGALLNDLNKLIYEKMEGLNINFCYKSFKQDKDLIDLYEKYKKEEVIKEQDEKQNEELEYEDVKRDFEKYCAKIIDKSIFIVEKFNNGKVCNVLQYTESKLSISYKHLSYVIKNKKGIVIKKCKFITDWLTDSNMRLYFNMDIYPDKKLLIEGDYNLWVDFDMEFINDYKQNNEGLEYILNHIRILCGNNENIYNYFVKWSAYVIQYPAMKSICPVFISKQGVGKGSLFDLFRKMLGNRKIMECTTPERDVWGDFNGEMLNSYLVNINELGKSQQKDSIGRIKGLITDQELIINQKGISQLKVKSYHKFIITTNNEDPIYTDENDRRFIIIRSSDEKKGDVEYFNKLHNYLQNTDVIKTCYEYFKNIPDIDLFPSIKMPLSIFHENLKEENKSTIIQFLERLYFINSDKTEVVYNSKDLYDEFRLFVVDHGIKYETNSLKLVCAISNLQLSSVSKKHSRQGNITNINITQLKNDLKIIDYFDNSKLINKRV